MTVRALPVEEWHKLEGTALGPAWRTLPTAGVTVLVVENTDGAIVAHWTLFQCLHAEHVWVAPGHRKRGVAIRHLLTGLRHVAAQIGTTAFITAAESDEVARLIEHLGGTRLPGDSFVIPVERSV